MTNMQITDQGKSPGFRIDGASQELGVFSRSRSTPSDGQVVTQTRTWATPTHKAAVDWAYAGCGLLRLGSLSRASGKGLSCKCLFDTIILGTIAQVLGVQKTHALLTRLYPYYIAEAPEYLLGLISYQHLRWLERTLSDL